ncbi:unnamed protein product [Mytilus edulis]|uniref:B box-type domain-containing protein n=1 Tax=Mytilus edulis TaxID=6550 RepID=A0A8S3TIH1_MYTED|nr:unnamed protein product [Mytilus edulis]
MSNNIKPCNICGSNSSVLQFCDKCKVQCCELCLGQHKHSKVCSLIVKHLGPTDGSCEIHQVPYNKFCLKCGILFCPLCLRSHCEHIDDVVSLIHAVKKIRREIPTLVKSLSAKITNAHHAVTARQAEVKEMQSVKKNIEVEKRIWNEIIVERADSLYRQINQKITDLNNDGIIQQQYMRKIGKTIDTIKSVEIVKYSSTFVLLWVCVNKELFQIEENEKAKSLLERIIFQSGIKDHSNICNIFGCLKRYVMLFEIPFGDIKPDQRFRYKFDALIEFCKFGI